VASSFSMSGIHPCWTGSSLDFIGRRIAKASVYRPRGSSPTMAKLTSNSTTFVCRPKLSRSRAANVTPNGEGVVALHNLTNITKGALSSNAGLIDLPRAFRRN
jgi:hypothetical protein